MIYQKLHANNMKNTPPVALKHKEKLLHGMRYGFDTGIIDAPTETYVCKNNYSALRDKAFVKQAILEEKLNKFIMGPFESVKFPVYRISPLSVAISKYSKKKRLVLDLSGPHSVDGVTSINDFRLICYSTCFFSRHNIKYFFLSTKEYSKKRNY